MKLFEAMTMFEQQIVYHKVPKAFNHVNIANDTGHSTKKQQKCIQVTKRRMLHMDLEQYETNIQHYDHLYEQELDTFKSEIYQLNSFYQMSCRDMLIHFVKMYLYHHTKTLVFISN